MKFLICLAIFVSATSAQVPIADTYINRTFNVMDAGFSSLHNSTIKMNLAWDGIAEQLKHNQSITSKTEDIKQLFTVFIEYWQKAAQKIGHC